MRPQPLRPFLLLAEQTQKISETPSALFADARLQLAMMRRATADLRQVIQTSVVSIAEAQETLRQANAHLAQRYSLPKWKHQPGEAPFLIWRLPPHASGHEIY
jgi:hypothetical protein